MARTDSFQKVWGSNPAQLETPPDIRISNGWVGGAQGELPRADWENWWHNRVDEALHEIEQNGAPQWFADVPYSAGATVRDDSRNWIAASNNTGVRPSGTGNNAWLELTPTATDSTVGLVQLASAAEVVAGTNTSKPVTPQALQALTSTADRRGLVELATAAEARAGTDAERAVTPLGLTSTVLGMGQSWQNMSGSRAADTTYTNTTGRPIFISFFTASAVSAGAWLEVDGLIVARTTQIAGPDGGFSSIIPSGSTYRISGLAAAGDINWLELR